MKQPVIIRKPGFVNYNMVTCTLACGHVRTYHEKRNKKAPNYGESVRCLECERERRNAKKGGTDEPR